MATHCQICGREIKIVRGWCRQTNATEDLIAHHGYRRPFQQGWQTSSCFGARWRPYEVAFDALPPAIASAEKWEANMATVIADMLANPPATMTRQPKFMGQPKGDPVVLTRPENFDVNAKGSYTPRTYEAEFRELRASRQRSLDAARESLRYMRKRLADWRPSEFVPVGKAG